MYAREDNISSSKRHIYIAGKFEAQVRLRDIRNQVEALGHRVVGTWLDEENEAPTAIDRFTYAIRDLAEVGASDLLILDTQDENARGGREVEYGVALGRRIEVWIVGPERNVFHKIADVHGKQFDTWDEALATLDLRPSHQ